MNGIGRGRIIADTLTMNLFRKGRKFNLRVPNLESKANKEAIPIAITNQPI